MSSSSDKANKALRILSTFQNVDLLIENIKNKEIAGEKSDRMPVEFGVSEASVKERLSFLKEETQQSLSFLCGEEKFNTF